MEMASLKKGEWFRGGLFNGGGMVMLEVVSLIEGEWFCYKDGLFNGGGMVMLEVDSLMGGRMVMLHGQFKGERMV